MKRIFLLIVLVAPLLVAAQKGAFRINGHVKDWTGKDSVFLLYFDEGKMVKDSLVADHGVFSFSGTISQPVETSVYLVNSVSKGTRDHRRFFMEKGILRIEAKDSLLYSVVSGSIINKDYEQLKKQVDPVVSRLVVLKQYAIKTTAEERRTDAFKEMEKEFHGLQDSIERIRVRFIKGHPASFLSLETLKTIAGSAVDYQKIFPLFNRLVPVLKTSPAGKELSEKLATAKTTGIGVVAPAFTSSDTSGNALSLKDVVAKGKVTLIDFWASWCKPCRAENPNVVKAYQAFHDMGFNIISVSLDQKASYWKAAIIHDGMPWYHVSSLKFWEEPVAILYGIHAVPDNFLLDANGKVIGRGLRSEALFTKVESLLK